MTRIDHMALYVRDLEEARRFFLEFFNGSSNQMYHNPVTGLRTYFISFPEGGRIEIMNRPDLVENGLSPLRRGYSHIAMGVGSRENVDKVTSRLSDAGYRVLTSPRVTGDGYYESSVLGVEDCIIEITE